MPEYLYLKNCYDDDGCWLMMYAVDDAYSCIRDRMIVENVVVAVAAGATPNEINDLVHSSNKRWHQLMMFQSMSCFTLPLLSSITRYLQQPKKTYKSPGPKAEEVNKLGLMSKMWFPALEKSSSCFYLRHLWTESKEIFFYRQQKTNRL
jgi:hypothetical protein